MNTVSETSEHGVMASVRLLYLSCSAVQAFLCGDELRADELLLAQLLFGLLQVLVRLLQPETSSHVDSILS